MQGKLRQKIRKKFPGMAKSASRQGKAAAIRLFCIECMGGSLNDARTCPETDCFLWPHWAARKRNAGPGASGGAK